MVRMYTVPASKAVARSEESFRMTYLTNAVISTGSSVRPNHSHKETTEVALVYEGSGVHHIDHREYHSQPGDLMIYNAGLVHQDRPNSTGTVCHYLCGIKGLQLEGQMPGAITGDPNCYLLRTGEYYDYLLNGFSMLERSLQQNARNTSIMAHGFLTSLLGIIAELIEHVEKDPSNGHAVEIPLESRVRLYIDRNYAENFSLEDIAREFHVNRYYISHCFSKSFGLPPIRYRTLRRIGEAQSLLLSTDESITTIAGLVGYDDPNLFTQTFTKTIGMSPSKYRELSVWPMTNG